MNFKTLEILGLFEFSGVWSQGLRGVAGFSLFMLAWVWSSHSTSSFILSPDTLDAPPTAENPETQRKPKVAPTDPPGNLKATPTERLQRPPENARVQGLGTKTSKFQQRSV